MPFAGFDDWDECIVTMTEEEGHDQSSAEQICGALQAEAKADNGNVDELRQALERGRGLIADVGVDILSGVGEPAIDSKWTMFKSEDGDHDFEGKSPLLLSKADDDSGEKRIAYAAAMIPRELDKEGDVVPTPAVEDAAHKYMTEDGGVDTDHSLIEGDGTAVESWVLKDERTFDLPGGGSETYPAGTWMVGIKWEKDAWERIQAGDLTGLSIYGMADSVPLDKSVAKEFVVPYADESVVNVLYASRSVAAKAAEAMGFEGAEDEITHPHDFGDQTHYMPAPSHEDYVDAYNEFADADKPLPDTDDGDTAIDDAYKEEDPCWEGYTMVGTKPNGNPRCVPDDEVDDADFDKAVEYDGGDPPSGATPTNDPDESAKQNSTMTDDTTGDDAGESKDGGDGGDTEPSNKEIADELAELKDAVTDDGGDTDTESTEKQSPMDMIADAADLLAEEDDVDASASEIEDMFIDVVDQIDDGNEGGEMDADGMDEKADGDDADAAEKSADDSANLAKGSTGNGTTATAKAADASGDDPLSYQAIAEQQAQEN